MQDRTPTQTSPKTLATQGPKEWIRDTSRTNKSSLSLLHVKGEKRVRLGRDARLFSTFVVAICIALSVGTTTLAALPAEAQAITHQLDIPAQDLGAALKTLSAAANEQVLFSDDVVAGLRSTRIKGDYSTHEAFTLLLGRSGLKAIRTNAGVFLIRSPDAASPPNGTSSSVLHSGEHVPQTNEGVLFPQGRWAGDKGIPASRQANRSLGQQTALAQAETSIRREEEQTISGSSFQGSQKRGELEEIIVTAQRFAQLLKDVPISITAFTSVSIDNNMIDDLTDYFNKTPNVSYLESGARSKRSVSIRGVSDIGGSANSIAVYVDEFGISNGPATINDDNINGSLNPELQDIERIEVLRGPQGTFFGRNAAAGAINITTKKPQPDFYAEGTAGYGRFNSWVLSGVVNTPMSDKFFLRTSAYVSQSDGFVKNADPAGGRSDDEYMSMRVAGRYVPNEQLTADIVATYSEDDQGLDSSVSTGVPNRSSAQLLGFLGLTGAVLDGLDAYPTNTTQVSHNNPLDQRNVFGTLVGRVQYDVDNLSIVSVTGFLDTAHDLTGDVDLTSFDFLNQSADVDTSSFSQEMRIQSNGADKLDWVVGGLYARDENIQKFIAHAGADGFLGLPEGFLFSDGRIDSTMTSYAIFGEATWLATERLSLILGGRYSRDDVGRVDDRISFEVRRPIVAGSKSFSDFSPRFVASYALTDAVTAYFTVAKGYKAGGVQTNPESDILPLTDFAEETLWSYEGGMKADVLDGRLRVNGSVFYYAWSDLQVLTGFNFQDPNNPGNILFLQFTDNAASASNRGVELEFAALPGPGLEIGGGIGYSDAKYDEFTDAVIFGQVFDLSGRRLPRSPKWTLNADAQYSWSVSDKYEAFVRTEWNYRAKTIPLFDATTEQGFPYRTPSFDVWNFRCGIRADGFSLVAYVENAFNEQYFTSLDPTFGFSGLQVHPSVRQIGLRVTLSTN